MVGNFYAAFNATHTTNGWRFDIPMPIIFALDEKSDCTASPKRFPCGATTAPDSQVSGSATEHDSDNDTRNVPLFDGFAAREISLGKKEPLWTRLVLSGTAVNPQVLALNASPRGLASSLNLVVVLEFDVTNGAGLSLDTSHPERLRGRVTADIKGAGKLDFTFDVGIASEYEESNMAL